MDIFDFKEKKMFRQADSQKHDLVAILIRLIQHAGNELVSAVNNSKNELKDDALFAKMKEGFGTIPNEIKTRLSQGSMPAVKSAFERWLSRGLMSKAMPENEAAEVIAGLKKSHAVLAKYTELEKTVSKFIETVGKVLQKAMIRDRFTKLADMLDQRGLVASADAVDKACQLFCTQRRA